LHSKTNNNEKLEVNVCLKYYATNEKHLTRHATNFEPYTSATLTTRTRYEGFLDNLVIEEAPLTEMIISPSPSSQKSANAPCILSNFIQLIC
jgi:hypothetical protein